MSSSSSGGANPPGAPPSGKGGFRNVPPPQGGSKGAGNYARFIPREELGEVASWKPGSFFGALDEAPAQPAAAAAAGTAATAHAAAANGPAAAGAGSPRPAGRTGAPGPITPEEAAERAQAARQAGYQDGYRDGMAALESFKQHFAAQATAQVGALLDAFDRQLAELDSQLAETLTRCAVQLARQVVRSELAVRPQLVAQVAGDALAAVMLSARHISVQAHPADLPLIREGAEEALESRGARLVADPAIARGGVLVSSELGSVDARIAERWTQAAGALDAGVPWSDEAAGTEPGP